MAHSHELLERAAKVGSGMTGPWLVGDAERAIREIVDPALDLLLDRLKPELDAYREVRLAAESLEDNTELGRRVRSILEPQVLEEHRHGAIERIEDGAMRVARREL